MTIHIDISYGIIYFLEICFALVPGEGNTVRLLLTNIYTIPQNSQNKEVAWEFISLLISDDFQMENAEEMTGIPILQKAIDLMMENSLEEEFQAGKPVVKDRFEIGDYLDEVTYVETDAMDGFRELLSREMKLRPYNETLLQIITEEAQFYLNDDKAIEQVIDIINNRIRLYLNEIG